MVRIHWTERAVKNLKHIYDYIAVDSKIYADHFTKRIVRASEKLRYYLLIGRVVPDALYIVLAVKVSWWK